MTSRAPAHDRMAAALGNGRGPLPGTGPLHRCDIEVLDGFLELRPGRHDRLECRAGAAEGFGTPISVLWLDGEPVAHTQGMGEGRTKAFVGAMDTDAFAGAARAYLLGQAGRGAARFVSAERDDGFTKSFAGDLGDRRFRIDPLTGNFVGGETRQSTADGDVESV